MTVVVGADQVGVVVVVVVVIADQVAVGVLQLIVTDRSFIVTCDCSCSC